MMEIKRFLVDGKRDSKYVNDLHPTFSFVVDVDDNLITINQILLKVNHHEIDVSSLTR